MWPSSPERGALKELTGDAAAAIQANYSDAWKALGTIDGKLYGVYFKVANKSVIWYRTDKFDERGRPAAEDLGGVPGHLKTLSDAGITPMVAAGGDGWVVTDWFENVYLRVGGADKYDQLAKHTIPMDRSDRGQTLQFWPTTGARQSTSRADRPGGTGRPSPSRSPTSSARSPKSAMLFEGDFVAAEINKLAKVKVGEGAKFFDWPSINGSKPAVVTAGDQAVAFKDTPATMALMAFLASPEAAPIMAARAGSSRPNKNLDPSAYPDQPTEQLADAVVNAELLRFDLSDLTPQSFGGGTSAHMWVLLQEFLSKPDLRPRHGPEARGRREEGLRE